MTVPAAKRLSMAERAAILRAARDRIQQLERELEILADRVTRHIPGAQTAYDIVKDELTLLSDGVRKLWLEGNGHE